MTTIQHEIRANCPPSAVWRLLSDLEAVQRYNPGVERAAIHGNLAAGVGAMRVCQLKPKGRVLERVTHWEEGRAVGLEVTESDWPIHFMRWVTRIAPNGTGSTISQILVYKVKFGPLGWLLDKLVMRHRLKTTLDAVFGSLVEHAENSR